MEQYKIDFESMAWETPAAGVRFKAFTTILTQTVPPESLPAIIYGLVGAAIFFT